MNRINKVFEKLRSEKRIALMPFAVAGFPNEKQCLRLLNLLAEKGDLLEIGFPYSDPLADGPVIQAANTQVLQQGMTVSKVFKLIQEFRKQNETPITVLVYVNILYQRGIEKFYKESKQAGIDGVLIPDLPYEESEIFSKAARKFGIAHVSLVSSTTSDDRIKETLKVTDGFIYLTSVLGVTGARKDIPTATLKYIRQLNQKTKLPVAVGFGISNQQQIKALSLSGASGAIIGSRLVQMIQLSSGFPTQEIRQFLQSLRP